MEMEEGEGCGGLHEREENEDRKVYGGEKKKSGSDRERIGGVEE